MIFEHPTDRDLNDEDWGKEFDDGWYYQLDETARPVGAYDTFTECELYLFNALLWLMSGEVPPATA